MADTGLPKRPLRQTLKPINMKTWIKIISVLVFTGFIAAVLAFYFLYNKPHPDYEKMEADYTLTATDLYTAFTTNKTEGGKKYNGKVIEIAGKLTKTEVTDTLTVCVFVFGKGMFGDEGIRCIMLPKYGVQAGKLPPGTDLKFKGYCTGFNDTDVILDKCSIVK
jgi:hypothetical protein